MSFRNKTDFRHLLIIVSIVCFFSTLIFLNYVFFSTRAYNYERSIQGHLPPLPGRFFSHFPINNYSYCTYNYGLPGRLNFTEKNLRYPPQEGANSSYRILYNVVESDHTEDVPKITYVTHVTVDFLFFIPEIVRYWDGPVSIAAFLPAQDAQIFFQKLSQICLCLPQMSRVSIHLVFPVNYEPSIEDSTNISSQDCNIRNEFPRKLNRVDNGLFYPINVGRNAAREAAKTHFVIVTDIELIPSRHMAKNFLKFVKVQKPSESKQVFVVPIFEVDCGYDMPLNKKDLLNAVKLGVVVYFHRFVCPHCQKFPGIDSWLGKANVRGIKPFLSVRREYPFHRWEPIFIGTKYEPLYDETLSWEGLQDKMTQMLQMCLLNYKFVILDGAFLVHWPGIKKRPQRANEAWRIPYIRKNSERYGKIIEHLSTSPEYTENRRCKLQ